MLAQALPALEQAAGVEVQGRVASSPNAFDDIVAELTGGATARSSSRRFRHTCRTGCTWTSPSDSAHLGYPLTTVTATH